MPPSPPTPTSTGLDLPRIGAPPEPTGPLGAGTRSKWGKPAGVGALGLETKAGATQNQSADDASEGRGGGRVRRRRRTLCQIRPNLVESDSDSNDVRVTPLRRNSTPQRADPSVPCSLAAADLRGGLRGTRAARPPSRSPLGPWTSAEGLGAHQSPRSFGQHVHVAEPTHASQPKCHRMSRELRRSGPVVLAQPLQPLRVRWQRPTQPTTLGAAGP